MIVYPWNAGVIGGVEDHEADPVEARHSFQGGKPEIAVRGAHHGRHRTLRQSVPIPPGAGLVAAGKLARGNHLARGRGSGPAKRERQCGEATPPGPGERKSTGAGQAFHRDGVGIGERRRPPWRMGRAFVNGPFVVAPDKLRGKRIVTDG